MTYVSSGTLSLYTTTNTVLPAHPAYIR